VAILSELAFAFQDFAAVNPGWLHWGSFPSDHAAYLTALGLGLYGLSRGVGTAALAIGIGVCCLARMFVGLHYASDVIAGVAVGTAAHLLISNARSGFAAPAFRQLRSKFEAHAWLQLGFAVLVVEMAVMFRDLRALDQLLFPVP
jgi:membrane-associated phospholipid phosphatase